MYAYLKFEKQSTEAGVSILSKFHEINAFLNAKLLTITHLAKLIFSIESQQSTVILQAYLNITCRLAS